MAGLFVSLFGGIDILLEGRPVSNLRSNKVRALLAYLAVEGHQPRRRETLAGLLWPDVPDAAALNSLRNALANLRQAFGDTRNTSSFLEITRDAVRLDPVADFWSDVPEFERLTGDLQWQGVDRVKSPSAITDLQAAISLYCGPFLAGFSVGSAPFEEWALYKREQLQRQAADALRLLAAYREDRGEYTMAQALLQKLLAIEPFDEEACRRSMRTHALSGQRSAALSQYEACRRLLGTELGIEPAHETTAMYVQIRDGLLGGMTGRQRLSSLTGVMTTSSPVTWSPGPLVKLPPFVAREVELAWLESHMDTALAGQGHVVFVAGEAGSGKTALMSQFTRQSMSTHGGLLALSGTCNVQANIGDPYLPFVEILRFLTGDIEAKRASGVVSPETARRFWEALPEVLRSLTECGPDLVGRFVPAATLALRVVDVGRSQKSWQRQLAALVARAAASEGDSLAFQPQMRLFDQVAAVLTTLAHVHPLLLVLDDLQWADDGTASLLFHLGRRLAGSRILIVGAYRPGDLAAGRHAVANADSAEVRHPLASVINELKRVDGDIVIDLAQADGRRFLDAYLDRDPNRLGAGFRDALYRHTDGNALFTVELLRGLQERGDLVLNAQTGWSVGPTLNWEHLPARVEAVIAERIGRLDPADQALLTAASVEGEEFTAEVLARVTSRDERALIQRLSGPLCRREGLVCAHSVLWLESSGQRLSRYRFQHSLFQKYLYQGLDDIERSGLHQVIGEALETLYHDSPAELAAMASRLAHHFQEAGQASKAAGYLLQAGGRATQLSASVEAIAYLDRGLRLLRTLPESPERARQELQFQLALGAPLMVARGWGTPERAAAFARATELSRRSGDLTDMLRAMLMQADYLRAIGDCERALALSDQMLELAEQTGHPLQLALAHYTAGGSLFLAGKLSPARRHLERGLALWQDRRDPVLISLMGMDLGIASRMWQSWLLWALGYPDQALRAIETALADARSTAQPFTLGMTLALAGLHLAVDRNDEPAVRGYLAELRQTLGAHFLPFFQGWMDLYSGWLKANAGQVSAGIAEMRGGIDAWEATGTRSGRPGQLSILADVCHRHGQIEQGLAAVTQGLDLIAETGLHYSEAELQRLKGDLLREKANAAGNGAGSAGGAGSADGAGSTDEVAACYLRAISLAREQDARLWELRATVSLCRLWREQGRTAEARERLDAIYSWFTEGFDMPTLQEARRLLEDLAGGRV